jgi:hypothetical protein
MGRAVAGPTSDLGDRDGLRFKPLTLEPLFRPVTGLESLILNH